MIGIHNYKGNHITTVMCIDMYTSYGQNVLPCPFTNALFSFSFRYTTVLWGCRRSNRTCWCTPLTTSWHRSHRAFEITNRSQCMNVYTHWERWWYIYIPRDPRDPSEEYPSLGDPLPHAILADRALFSFCWLNHSVGSNVFPDNLCTYMFMNTVNYCGGRVEYTSNVIFVLTT